MCIKDHNYYYFKSLNLLQRAKLLSSLPEEVAVDSYFIEAFSTENSNEEELFNSILYLMISYESFFKKECGLKNTSNKTIEYYIHDNWTKEKINKHNVFFKDLREFRNNYVHGNYYKTNVILQDLFVNSLIYIYEIMFQKKFNIEDFLEQYISYLSKHSANKVFIPGDRKTIFIKHNLLISIFYSLLRDEGDKNSKEYIYKFLKLANHNNKKTKLCINCRRFIPDNKISQDNKEDNEEIKQNFNNEKNNRVPIFHNKECRLFYSYSEKDKKCLVCKKIESELF